VLLEKQFTNLRKILKKCIILDSYFYDEGMSRKGGHAHMNLAEKETKRISTSTPPRWSVHRSANQNGAAKGEKLF